jgi:hypothetical protein
MNDNMGEKFEFKPWTIEEVTERFKEYQLTSTMKK